MEENTTVIGYPAHDRTYIPLSAETNISEKLAKRISASGGN